MPLRRAMPALLTRIVTGPTFSAMRFAIAHASSRRVTSSAKLSALPPASANLPGGLGGRCLVHVEQHHARALACVAERDGAPDARSQRR